MGVNNRQRRKEKLKQRQRRDRRGPDAGPRFEYGARTPDLRDAWWVYAGLRDGDVRRAVTTLDTAPFDDVVDVAETMLDWIVAAVWTRGWQPAELVRYGRRNAPGVGRLLETAVAADHVRRDRASMHPRWLAQADAVAAAVPTPPGHDGWLHGAVEAEGRRRGFAMSLIVRAMRLAGEAMPLPELLPPPGTDPAVWDRDNAAPADDDPALAKVHALLAQAESTTFEAEAEAFTAKAQALMARHAIDAALVWSRSADKDRPISIRIPVDSPYADEKAKLLHVVAANSRCKAVLLTEVGLVSVFGFRSDLVAAELLYTSLLVQSQAAMRAEAATAPVGSHVRGATFRRAFLHGYAARIGHRLAAVNQEVQGDRAETAAGVGGGPDLLPVLAARDDAVAEAVREQLGETAQVRGPRYYDRLGAVRGGLAADRAELNPAVAAEQAPAVPVERSAELAGRLF